MGGRLWHVISVMQSGENDKRPDQTFWSGWGKEEHAPTMSYGGETLVRPKQRSVSKKLHEMKCSLNILWPHLNLMDSMLLRL